MGLESTTTYTHTIDAAQARERPVNAAATIPFGGQGDSSKRRC